MKLVQLKVKNFRCYSHETVDIDDLTVLVGKNDSGKSTLFHALNLFFNSKDSPEKSDLSIGASEAIIEITCVFENFQKNIIIDAQHQTTLSSEYLLNKENKLEIVVKFDCSDEKPKSRKTFLRANHPRTEGYNNLHSLKNNKLKEMFEQAIERVDEKERETLEDVNKSINPDLRKAIWQTCDELNLGEVEIEITGEETKKIWSEINDSIPLFFYFRSDRPSTDQDEEAQDPLKIALKQATDKQSHVLDEISNKIKEEVNAVAMQTIEKLKEMNPEFGVEIEPDIQPKKLESLFSVNLVGSDNIPMNKRGSGTRRLILFNFFRVQAERQLEEPDNSGRNLIYAIEEPETSQHPNNQKIVLEAFEDLVYNSNFQIMFSTHTPTLARQVGTDFLRFITEENERTKVLSGKSNDTLEKIIESLGVIPDHDVKLFFGVEGPNDRNFFLNISKYLHKIDPTIPDLKQAVDDGKLIFILLGGGNLSHWVSTFKKLPIDEFYLIDGDDKKLDKSAKMHINELESRGCDVLRTKKRELENYLHKDAIIDYFNKNEKAIPKFEGKNDPKEDIPELFAMAVHNSSESETAWNDLKDDAKGKKISNAKKKLNSEVVLEMTLERLKDIDKDGEVIGWLKKIGKKLT